MDTERSWKAGLLIWVPFALAIGGVLLYAVWMLGGEPRATKELVYWAYDLSFLLAGLACLGRAFVSPSVRLAWIAFGLGLISWSAGDIWWTQMYSGSRAPYPSPADLGYLLAPLFFFAGIALLVRARVGGFTVASRLDAAIGALAAATLGTAVLAPALEGLTRGDTAAVLTNVSYPLVDLILVAMIAGSMMLGNLRGARSLLAVGAGLLVWTGADIHYLFLEATGSYEPGWIDLTWPAGALLIGGAALISPSQDRSGQGSTRFTFALPVVFSLIAVSVLVWDHFERLRGVTVWLAAATLLVVAARLALSFRENDRLMNALEDDVVTDALTGLGNRRSLFADLENVIGGREADRRHAFGLFDLDGFKGYNDSFGHPAGDALLRRLGAALAAAVGPLGRAYRLGGDEFCILVELDRDSPERIAESAREALSERGEGFAIGASGGWILLPDDAERPDEALRVADQRMYAEKSRRSSSTLRQTGEVLMRIFHEREPALGSHSEGVARLAIATGRRLGLSGEHQDVLGRAAELHDVGKIAIPDEVLRKPGPLDPVEWELIHRHTLIGERILGATPAMRPVAALVRASHERWDGAGYPDGLAGDEIPLGARIICICDSFDAMISSRPYQAAVSREQALAELRRCAGTQFDPELVEIFATTLEEIGSEGRVGTDETLDPVTGA